MVDDRTRVTPQAASRLRIAVMRLARTLRTTSAEEGLTPAQSGVLATLVREGTTRAGDLAAAEGVNPTMLSRILGHLEERALVRRRPDDDDRRVTWCAATPAGRRLIGRLRARREALVVGHLEGLSAAERRALMAALPALEALADVADAAAAERRAGGTG